MYTNQYEEHLAHSAPCNSRWDGFDRSADFEINQGSKVIGRMTSGGGYKVEITEVWHESDIYFEVSYRGKRVWWAEDRAKAIAVARWWLDGCPA